MERKKKRIAVEYEIALVLSHFYVEPLGNIGSSR